MDDERKNTHIIDTRFTFSGPRAEEFLKMVKQEYGLPLPYAAVRQYIKLACIYYLEARKKTKNQESNNG